MNKPFHTKIRELRRERGWTQEQLAARVNRRRHRVASLETGRRIPTRDEVRAYARIFGLSVHELEPPARHPTRQVRARRRGVYRLFRARLPRVKRAAQVPAWVRILHARRVYGQLAEQLVKRTRQRADRPVIRRLLPACWPGSRDEAMVLLHALGQGAMLEEFSLMRLGYRTLPVIDDTQRIVGDRPVVGLLLEGDPPILLFPQVSVLLVDRPPDYPYRSATMDFLVAVFVRGLIRWIHLEVDGDGHDSRLDLVRARLIGLPRLKVRPEDLMRSDFLDWLKGQIEGISAPPEDLAAA